MTKQRTRPTTSTTLQTKQQTTPTTQQPRNSPKKPPQQRDVHPIHTTSPTQVDDGTSDAQDDEVDGTQDTEESYVS